ncbi:MAG: type II secretion system protein GspG [Armatimonadia bacterium]|nr:type II secretion system protein GspG [Armatimonadia bacterium]
MYRRSQGRRLRGFTLTELLVVMVIIVLLAGVAVTYVPKRIEEARVAKTQAEIKTLENAISQYQIHMMDVPSQSEGLEALVTKPDANRNADRWKGPYLQPPVVPNDAWGREYIYRTPGSHNMDYDLLSVGKDGQEGSEDDITSWEHFEA